MRTTAQFPLNPGAEVNSYGLCGWRVASTLPLPDLRLWTGDDRRPDLSIDLGPVPARLTDLKLERPLLQVAADDTTRFAVPGVGAYLIDPEGRSVVIDPEIEAAAPDIRVFLLGTVFGIICYRRGLLPLHASCVRIGDRAVALAGTSGVGKSTLAAALLRHGCAVLADDVTVVDVGAPGGPQVLSTFPRLKLWHDAMTRMEFPTDGLERCRPDLEKFSLPIGASHCADPLPLAAVFHLDPDIPRRDGLLRRLHGPEAVARIGRDLYRRAMMVRFGLSAEVLASTLQVARAPAGIWLLAHGHEPGDLDRSVACILDRMADAGAP